MMWKMSHMTEVEKYCAIYDKMSDIRNAVKDKLNSLLYFKNKKPRKKINTVEKEECERKLQLILEKRRELNSAHDKQLEKIEENIRRLETFGITITKSNVSGKNVTLTKKDGSKEVMRLVMSMSH
jgi:MFS superfamily sulfate permease-like transporter